MRNRQGQKINKLRKPDTFSKYWETGGARVIVGRGYTEGPGKGTVPRPDPTANTAIKEAEKYERGLRKMQRKQAIATIDLGPELKDNLEKVAQIRKMSLSKLIKECLHFSLAFDDPFKSFTESYANDLGISPSFLIGRLALAHLAEMAAEEELMGGRIPNNGLIEFVPGLTSREFFDMWKDDKVRQGRSEKQGSSEMALSDKGKARLEELKKQTRKP